MPGLEDKPILFCNLEGIFVKKKKDVQLDPSFLHALLAHASKWRGMFTSRDLQVQPKDGATWAPSRLLVWLNFVRKDPTKPISRPSETASSPPFRALSHRSPVEHDRTVKTVKSQNAFRVRQLRRKFEKFHRNAILIRFTGQIDDDTAVRLIMILKRFEKRPLDRSKSQFFLVTTKCYSSFFVPRVV